MRAAAATSRSGDGYTRQVAVEPMCEVEPEDLREQRDPLHPAFANARVDERRRQRDGSAEIDEQVRQALADLFDLGFRESVIALVLIPLRALEDVASGDSRAEVLERVAEDNMRYSARRLIDVGCGFARPVVREAD